MLYISQAWSSGGGVERTPRTKTFDDVVGVDGGGVRAGGGTRAIAAGADTIGLASETGTATDLGPRGTR